MIIIITMIIIIMIIIIIPPALLLGARRRQVSPAVRGLVLDPAEDGSVAAYHSTV